MLVCACLPGSSVQSVNQRGRCCHNMRQPGKCAAHLSLLISKSRRGSTAASPPGPARQSHSWDAFRPSQKQQSKYPLVARSDSIRSVCRSCMHPTTRRDRPATDRDPGGGRADGHRRRSAATLRSAGTRSCLGPPFRQTQCSRMGTRWTQALKTRCCASCQQTRSLPGRPVLR